MKRLLALLIFILSYSVIQAQCDYHPRSINPAITSDRLQSILFVDDTTGYIIGHNKTLLHTRDEGKNWEQMKFPETEMSYFRNSGMVFDESVDSIIIYGSHILKTDLAFNHITSLKPHYNDQAFGLTDLYISPSGYWFGDSNQSKELYVSTDKGKSWEPSKINDFLGPYDSWKDIRFLEDDIGFASTNNGNIYQSLDGGKSWGLFYSQDAYYFNKLEPVSKDTVIVSCTGGILKTEDGGITWKRNMLPDEDQYIYLMEFITADTGYVISRNTQELEQALYATGDGGLSWTKVESFDNSFNQNVEDFIIKGDMGYVTGRFGLIAKIDLKTLTCHYSNGKNTYEIRKADHNGRGNVIAACHEGRVLISNDNGNTFELKELPYGDMNFEYVEYFNRDTIILAGGNYSDNKGILLFSPDGGESWEKLLELTTDPIRYADIHENGAVLVAGKKSIYHADHFAGIYSEISQMDYSGYQKLDRVKFVNDSSWLVTSSGERTLVERTIDSGKTYRPVYTNDLYPFGVQSLQFINDTTGFMCGEFYQLLKTKDGGKNWKVISELESNLNKSILFVDENKGFFLSSSRLYQTTNGGEIWLREHNQQFNNQMGELIALNNNSFGVFGKGGTIVKFDYERLDSLAFDSRQYTYCLDQRVEFEFPLTNNVYYNWLLDDQLFSNSNSIYTFVDQPGNYELSLARRNNCYDKDTITTSIEILDEKTPEKPILEFSEDTLFTDASHQIIWYYNKNVIARNDTSFYIPDEFGTYEVVDSNFCGMAASEPYVYDVHSSLENISSQAESMIYPNPAAQSIHIRIGNDERIHAIEIYSLNGKKIKIMRIPKRKYMTLQIGSLEKGAYILRIKTKNKYYQHTILIDRTY
jgi:photosystem II stability/assembly factor-like uncharacterized protein